MHATAAAVVALLLALLALAALASVKPDLASSASSTGADRIDASYVRCIKRLCEHYFRAEHAMKGSLVIMNLTPDPTPFQSHIIGSLDEDAAHEFSLMVKDSRKPHMNASHVSEKVRAQRSRATD